MGRERSVINPLHTSTKRDYLARMNDGKVECMKYASKYGEEFWDGDRRYGYGGYNYDGRQKVIAESLIKEFKLEDGCSILDVGCGKGFLLFEFKKLLPNCHVAGFDISDYAVKNCKEEVKENLFVYDSSKPFPFKDKEFDLVTSVTTLHNLPVYDLKTALKEMQRVGEKHYLAVESYRNQEELFNLQCWALTCQSFYSKKEWLWIFEEFGYKGDYEFIYFQ